MALRSKNFLFKRKNTQGEYMNYSASDVWFPTNTDYHWNEKTEPLAAGGYYGSTTGLHTIAFTLRNFIGRVSVQATLASNPEESDWFNLQFSETCGVYLEFADQRIYNASTDTIIVNSGTTGTFSETVVGNFTYLRIVIDRSYISINPTDDQKRIAGCLEECLINF